jgi:hypothetical protein
MVGKLAVTQVKLDESGKAKWRGQFAFRGRFTVRAI